MTARHRRPAVMLVAAAALLALAVAARRPTGPYLLSLARQMPELPGRYAV